MSRSRPLSPPHSKIRRFSSSSIYVRPTIRKHPDDFSDPFSFPHPAKLNVPSTAQPEPINDSFKVRSSPDLPRTAHEWPHRPAPLNLNLDTSMPHNRKPTYASLPSTPNHLPSPLTSPPPNIPPLEPLNNPPFSLWEYFREELFATDFDSHQELKWERVSNFLSVPIGVEKIISFGCVLCLDSFLHTFTILPIRFMLALYRSTIDIVTLSKNSLPPSQKADVIRALLIILSITILIPFTDASKIYHSIRGQDTIKLYVIFNALEIADRLFTSIGQDILDCMFSRSTLVQLSLHVTPTSSSIRPLLYFFLSVCYIVLHALILVYQLTSLNVAINAYDHSLLTLLLSNQFVEIKGSVFKKFEKDNLFQITCADIVERFQLSLMLVSIALRNLVELTSMELDFSSDGAILPQAFQFFRSKNIVWTIFFPVFTVILSELAVDWLKHAFITKFNSIRPSVYERFTDILCRDLATSQGSWVGKKGSVRKHTYVDQSPLVARRLGFASLPLAVLAVLISWQSLSLFLATYFSSLPYNPMEDGLGAMVARNIKWIPLAVLFWLCMVTVKVILGVNLLSYARWRRIGMDERAREDEELNDYGRPPIGEGKEERAYNEELKGLLNQARDDVPYVPEMGERPKENGDWEKDKPASGRSRGRKKVKLEELTRFTMVKRIW